jgi:hypothetical protein
VSAVTATTKNKNKKSAPTTTNNKKSAAAAAAAPAAEVSTAAAAPAADDAATSAPAADAESTGATAESTAAAPADAATSAPADDAAAPAAESTGADPETTAPPATVKQPEGKKKTAEDYARAETAGKLALAEWAEFIARTYLLDEASDMAQGYLAQRKRAAEADDDEEPIDDAEIPEQWNALIEEAVAKGLKEYPNQTVTVRDRDGNEQPVSVDMTKRFTDRILINRVAAALEDLLREQYQPDIKTEIPGKDRKAYGKHFKVSSEGVYCNAVGEEESHDNLMTEVFEDGWVRIAKTRIEPLAWSYQFGAERQAWRNHFEITDRDGHKRTIKIPRENLGAGGSAIKQLNSLGVRVFIAKDKRTALLRFLRWEPTAKIVRVPHTGWVPDSGQWLFIRPDRTLIGRQTKKQQHLRYEFDGDGTSHGLQISGTVEDWKRHVVAPLEGCSNVALSVATFFATPLILFVHEQPGGWHIYGSSKIGKSLCAAVGQSVYGLPYPPGTGHDTFGRSWQGTSTGIEQFAALRSDVGLALDEIGVGAVHPIKDAVYALSGGAEKLRATGQLSLQHSKGFRVLVLSTGEKSLVVFLGARDDAEGRRTRLVDVLAEVAPGTALETVPPQQVVDTARTLYAALKNYHGAVGLAWQQHLVDLGEAKIRSQVEGYRTAWLAHSAVKDLENQAHPQVRSVIHRFGLMVAALRMAIEAGLLP